MNHIVPKRHLVYSPAFREQLDARRAGRSKGRNAGAIVKLRLSLLDRRDSLATLIDLKSQQVEAHVAEFDEIERQIAELEGRST